MKQTNAEGPTAGPAGEGLEMAKHPLGLVSAVLGEDQNGDQNGNDTSECPKNSSSLTRAKLADCHPNRNLPSKRDCAKGKMKNGKTYIQPWKPLVAKRRDSIAEQRQSQEDEEHLPGLGRKNTNTRLLFKHIDAGDEEQGAAKVDGQSDGDVANDEEPAADPTCDAPPSGRSQHKRLIVDT